MREAESPASRSLPAPSPAPGWRGAFSDLFWEHGFVPLEVRGRVPDDLHGVLYRNGPSRFSRFGRPYGHPFDGDGAVSAVRFGEGRAEGAIRLVESEGWKREQAARRPLYGGWGTPVPAGLMRGFQGSAKSPANTSVMMHRGRLFALYEGGLPVEIDPHTLATRGACDLSGAIRASFSAHPRFCPTRRAFYNFGVRYNVVSWADLYECPADGPVRRIHSVALPGAPIVHDFAVAGDSLLFLIPPVRGNLYTAAFGRRPMQDSFSWQPDKGLEVVLVSLRPPHRVTRFTSDPLHLWHVVDAWEDQGSIRVDVVAYPDFATNAWFGGLLRDQPNDPANASLARLTIDPARRRIEREQLWSASCEFPVVAPAVRARQHRFGYLLRHSDAEAARGWWDQIAKLDFETGRSWLFPVASGQYPSEAIFVPRPNATREDDGYLVAHVFDSRSRRTHVAIWRATDPEQEPLGLAYFAHPIPFTFHGIWQPS
jgi:carotenoid cleavage dioxygenase-like enzyme